MLASVLDKRYWVGFLISKMDMLKIKGADTFKCSAISSPVTKIKCYNEFIGFGA